MKRMLVVFFLLGFGLNVGLAQSLSDETPATKEDVEQLFTTMHVREQVLNMMDVAMKQSREMAGETLRKKMPDISQKDVDRMNSMIDASLKDFDVDGMIDDMVPVYQHHLTKADISAMATFYQTPTGQKLLREQPQMTAEAMKAMQPRMQKMMSTMVDQAEKMAKEAKSGSTPGSGESKPTTDKN